MDILGKFISGAMIIIGVLFVPFILILGKTENISQSAVETLCVEYIDDARSTGRLSKEAYESFYTKVTNYVEFAEVELSHESKVEGYDDVDGEYTYYELYTNDEIVDVLFDDRDYKLKNGDRIKVTVKNTHPTMYQRIISVIYRNVSGASIYYTYSGEVGNYSEE